MKFDSLFERVKLKIGGKNSKIYNFDHKLVQTAVGKKVPSLKQILHVKKVLTEKEKIIFFFLLLIFVVGLVWTAKVFFNRHIVQVPDIGGSYLEGEVGVPQLVNPIFSSSNDVDADISALVFSGLMRYDEKQKLATDLAANYEISSDKKIYTFKLKQDVLWHDGEKFTAKDVLFTIETIQNLAVNSPLNVSFQGVKVEAIDDYTVRFILPQAFNSFLSILTVGIIPEHLWFDIQPNQMRLAALNLKPVGTGSFMFKKLIKDESGRIYRYELVRFNKHYRQTAYLQDFIFQFYEDYAGEAGAVQAFREQKIDGINFVPYDLKDKVDRKHVGLHIMQLPQYTALFFNENNSAILTDKSIRQALFYAVDKDKIVREVLKDDAKVIVGPILFGFPGYDSEANKATYSPLEANKLLDQKWPRITLDEYKEMRKKEITGEYGAQMKVLTTSTSTTSTVELEKINLEIENRLKQEFAGGQTFYRKNKEGKILQIIITTSDNEQYRKVAELIASFWQDVGVKTNIVQVGAHDMIRDVLKERNYSVLLYGEIVGSDPDPYPFWHSSQVNYPGLNLARFSNRNVDSLIEKARGVTDTAQLASIYKSFQTALLAEYPAIFLYSPTYTYVTSDRIKSVDVTSISKPADRFADVATWYLNTKGEWKWK